MDLEHGSKDSKLPGIVVDESGEIKQSETPAKVPDGSEDIITQSQTHAQVYDTIGESKQSETQAKVPDKSGEVEQSKTTVKVLDGSGESTKQSETHAKDPDGSGEIEQSKTHIKDDGSEDGKQSKTQEKLHDGGEGSKQSETQEKVHDGSRDIEALAKVSDKNGESKHLETPAKVSNEQSETHEKVHDESGEIKQLEADAKVSDRSKESNQLETPMKVLDENEESQQLKAPPKISDGSEGSKQSETHDGKTVKTSAIVLDGSHEESKQLERHPKVSDGNGESKHQETLPKVNDGMSYPPLQSKVVEANAKRSHRRAPSESLQEVNDGSSGRNKHPSSPAFPSKVAEAAANKGGHRRAPSVPRVHEIKHSASPYKAVEASTAKGGHTRNPSDRLLSFTSTSSSGSDTSMDDLFQVDSTRFSTSLSQIPPLPNSPYRARMSNVTPMESPPGMQMMDRYGGYDPYRIPASVFDTTNLSNKEMDWSVASNESLFSLHLGNNSFSRDHVVMIGDLTPTKSPELFGISTPRTPPPVVGRQINRIEEGRESAGEDMADEYINITNNAGIRASVEYHTPPIVSSPKAPSLVPSLAPSHRSDGSAISGASAKSFAFPILADGTKNSLKLEQDLEEQRLELRQISATKKPKKKKTRWFPCFSWCCCCCKWSCGCFSWCSCPRIFSCHRICCSCRRCCSCSRCFRRACFCF